MAKKRSALARRAWNLLRTALLFARKGGALRRRLAGLLSGGGHSGHLRYYRERELSFDETPTFRFRMRRPRIPCISPAVDFDVPDVGNDDNNTLYLHGNEYYVDGDAVNGNGMECEADGEKGIDSKAEEFIARFYETMKLQREVSVLQYNEMLHRGMS